MAEGRGIARGRASPLRRGLSAALAERRDQGLYRFRRTLNSPQGVEVTVDGRRCLAFCSNDYLGLADHPELVQAFIRAAERYGIGSGAAHLISGHNPEHQALEETLADWLGRSRALLFSTGYMANLGAITALTGPGDRIFEDRLNHASLIDGALLSGARLQRYAHGEPDALARRLAAADAGAALVVSDGVFSMDGDLAPLAALADVSARQGAWLMVDDAHGLGVVGPEGAGAVAQAGLGEAEVPVLVGTLGKALGTFGAFVAGSDDLIEALIQWARTYIYTTAPPPAVAAATRAAIDLAQRESWRRDKLQALTTRFRRGAHELGLPLLPSETPIQPLLVGSSDAAVRLSDALWAQGIWVTAVRPPTVPAGAARLRITFSARHEEAHVDRLLSALEASGVA